MAECPRLSRYRLTPSEYDSSPHAGVTPVVFALIVAAAPATFAKRECVGAVSLRGTSTTSVGQERTARAGNRRFWLSSVLRAHTKTPYKNRFT